MERFTQKTTRDPSQVPNPVQALRGQRRRGSRVAMFIAIGVACVGSLVVAPAGMRVGILAVEAVTMILGIVVWLAVSTSGRLKSADKHMDGMEAAHIRAGTRE